MGFTYVPPTRKDMNNGIFPIGKPPTLRAIREGKARMPNKPFTIFESKLMRKWNTDVFTAKKLEKEYQKSKEKEEKEKEGVPGLI